MNAMCRWMVGLLLMLSVTSAGLPSATQSWPAGERAGEYQLKSAFVYNLMAFVDWPQGALGDRIVVGFAGEGPMEAALSAFLKNKSVGSSAIEVRVVHARNDLRACNVLYLAYPDSTRTRDGLAQVRNASVLTIGDGEEFVRMGGVIGLVAQQKTLRLAINPAAAQRARLTISAKVLNMASIVKEEGGARN